MMIVLLKSRFLADDHSNHQQSAGQMACIPDGNCSIVHSLEKYTPVRAVLK